MYDYNNDPRGLRKKKLRWRVLAQQYGSVAAAAGVFLLVCALVALAGSVKHWRAHAQHHETSHQALRASHSALETALQMRDREAKERHATHEAASKQVAELQRHLEEERRHKAGTESEHQAAKRELEEYRELAETASLELEAAHHHLDARHEQLVRAQAAANAAAADAEAHKAGAGTTQQEVAALQHRLDAAQLDLDTCLHSVSGHSTGREEADRQIADLQSRLAAHESRELQLLKDKQVLEQALRGSHAAASGGSSGSGVPAVPPNAPRSVPDAPKLPQQHEADPVRLLAEQGKAPQAH